MKKNTTKVLTACLYNGIARRVWKTFDRIDAMPMHSLDGLCAKEKEIAKARKRFNALPAHVKEAIGNIRKSALF